MRRIIAMACVFVATTVSAQDTPPSRGGGSAAVPTAGLSREELVRSWDLDRDGTLSTSEAEVARARMKRERLETQLGAGLDPITGRPRGEGSESADRDADSPYQLPPELPPVTQPPGSTTTPGISQPKVRPKTMAELAAPIMAAPTVPGLPNAPMTTPSGSSTPITAERSSRASWLPPTSKGNTGAGGPRAGAPPAVPGYGAGSWSDLNAGRPLPSTRTTHPATAADGRTGVTGGGLLPSSRAAGRTGALLLPGQTVPKLAPLVPTTPPRPRATLPRITAEDIGGYRP